MKPAQFRHSVSIFLGGLVALLGAVPLATSGFGAFGGTPWWAYPLVLILLAPILVMLWGWRTGVDADRDGLRLRAMFGSRRLEWARVSAFAPRGRQVVALLDDGGSVALPAVAPADLPRLVAASGRALEPAADSTAGRAPGQAAGSASDQARDRDQSAQAPADPSASAAR